MLRMQQGEPFQSSSKSVLSLGAGFRKKPLLESVKTENLKALEDPCSLTFLPLMLDPFLHFATLTKMTTSHILRYPF